jgi:hypothetical protein
MERRHNRKGRGHDKKPMWMDLGMSMVIETGIGIGNIQMNVKRKGQAMHAPCY